eukprot:6678824-Heterocapsa_arctica.AAC.1
MERKGDKEAEMEADKSNGEALRYSAEEPKGDREVQQFHIGEEHEQSAGTKTENIKNESSRTKIQEDEPDLREVQPYV